MKQVRQLKSILNATQWSQEQLAAKLDVSFVTLNSWINSKSTPRNKALIKIEKLLHETVGVDDVVQEDLKEIKKKVKSLRLSPKELVSDEKLLDKLTLHLTYHTNTIEGSTMTLSDVEDVVLGQKVLSNRTAVEQAEARNHQAALHWLIAKINREGEGFTIDETLVRDIHLRLMNGIMADAGSFRQHSARIMGSNVALANWQSIENNLQELFSTQTSNSLIAGLARTHAAFEKIHPFSDGNGRTGRLLMLGQALQKGAIPPLVMKERKYAYYKYLEAAQTESRFDMLEMFIAESILFANTLLES